MTGPPTAADVAVAVLGVEAMVGEVLAAAVLTGALVPVDELHPAMTRLAARASTDPRMTPSSGARGRVLPHGSLAHQQVDTARSIRVLF
jgi:hypothetical protein